MKNKLILLSLVVFQTACSGGSSGVEPATSANDNAGVTNATNGADANNIFKGGSSTVISGVSTTSQVKTTIASDVTTTQSSPKLLTEKEKIEALEKIGKLPTLDRSDSLLGPDLDNNGIRDDIEAYILTQNFTEPIKKAAQQVAKAFSNILKADPLDPLSVKSAGQTTYVNLWVNPTAIYEAMELADLVRQCTPAQIEGGSISSIKTLSKRNLAEVVALEPTVGDAQWIGVQFAQAITLRTAVLLGKGMLSVPGNQNIVNVPLCKINDLGTLGYDTRDIHDAFEMSSTDWSPYHAFWNHDSTTVLSISQKSNAFLLARDKPAKGRKIKDPYSVAASAGRILLVERVRTNTHRVLAIGLDEAVLGNTWWELKSQINSTQEKALLLWLNSTMSVLLVLSHRVTSQGSWMNFKKPQWQAMPVLDVRTLSDETLTKLAFAYDTLCNKELMALGKLGKDPVRAAIDDALSMALGLPDIKPLRQLLSREPGLTGVGLSRKPDQQSLLPDADTESVHVPTQMSLL